MRPLLLLDVDGVLMPIGRSGSQGYARHCTAEYDVVVSEPLGAWPRSLARSFDLVWATTWGPSARTVFGTLLHLPEMVVLPLGTLPRDGTRKLPAVRDFVGERAVAWVDDEFYEDAFEWTAGRSPPTLLIRTSAAVGLTEEEVEWLRAFGDR